MRHGVPKEGMELKLRTWNRGWLDLKFEEGPVQEPHLAEECLTGFSSVIDDGRQRAQQVANSTSAPVMAACGYQTDRDIGRLFTTPPLSHTTWK